MIRPLVRALPLLLLSAPLSAQVGHEPGSSPYREIRHGLSLTPLVGDVGGNGGRVGVGPHNGQSYGLRFDYRVSAPVQLGLTLGRAELERLVVSAEDSVATRVKGPVDQNLTMVEATLQLNLTGQKTWHRLAPFISGSVGWTHGSDLPRGAPADSSGYDFGSKFYLVPSIGTRLFVTSNLFLRLEARQLFWKLKYPLSYTEEPDAEPSTDPDNPNAVLKSGKRDEWSGGRELRVGLGFAF